LFIFTFVPKPNKVKKKFLSNLILIVSLNLLVKPFYIFGIDRGVQNIVGASEYGLYFALFNLSMIMNILLDVGITNFNNREIAQNNHLLGKYFSNIVGIKFLLGIVYAIICITAGILVGYDSRHMTLLMILVFNQFLSSFLLYLRSNISGLLLFRTDSFLSVLDRTLLIIICSVLLWGHLTSRTITIEWFALAQSCSYGLAAIVAFIIVFIKAGKLKFKLDLKYLFLILRQSYPYALLILLMAFYNRIDSVMLERLLPDGKVQSGIYAQGFRILDAFGNFALLFSGLLLPLFAHMMKAHDPVGPMIRLSYSLLIVPALIIASVSVFYGKEIMEALYHTHLNESAAVFSVLMFGFTGICTTYIFGTLLTANGSLHQLNIMAFCGLIVNVMLNLILIPHFQALGSAFASLTTQVVTGLIQILLAWKILKLEVNAKYIMELVSFFVLILVAGFIINLVAYPWLWKMLFFILLSTSIAVAMRLLDIKGLISILKSQE
jgi:O-antigen/teichoic acid export membrane protein